jgi:pimeloyl-ACP methyl ester carboxylesterase
MRIVKKILKIVAILIAAFIILGILFIVVIRACNYLHHKSMYKHGVNESSYIELNGQKQFVTIKGENRNNPVIIYLHGGPGGADSYMNYCFTDYLTDEYTVVSWDQRGCGRTYYKNAKVDPLNKTVTFRQSLEDLDALVKYVCDKLNQDNVIIMGHSYGTVLGSVYANSHGDLVKAYIGVGQFISIEDGDLYSYEDALKKAKESNMDTKDLEKAYGNYCKEPGIMSLIALRQETDKYHPVTKKADQFGRALFSPSAGILDLKWFMKQMTDTEKYVLLNHELFEYTLAFNAYDRPDYSMPVCFISGEQDFVCPLDSVSKYYEAVNSPLKKMYVIKDCGHDVHYAEPREFCKDIKEFLNSI